MKVALVYDRVNKIGGAERILTELHKLYPDAPLYTLVYNRQRAAWADTIHVVTSFLQNIPWARRYHEFFPVLPIFAFEQFDFSAFDIVISVTASEAKGIITSPHQLHISYILTPTRYLWSHYEDYFTNKWLRTLALPFISFLRSWDQIAANRPDVIVAISETCLKRIEKYYRRKAKVIYPPVDTQKYRRLNSKLRLIEAHYFLIVSRLVPYKKIDIAIEACNQLNLSLKIVGEGLDKHRLKKMAGPTIEFVSNLTDEQLIAYYQNCRCFLIPQEEDFGIAMVEALSAGKPVVAYRKGGATEVITEGITGEFFYPQTKEALVTTLEKFVKNTYSQALCQEIASNFSHERFAGEFNTLVNIEMKRFKHK